MYISVHLTYFKFSSYHEVVSLLSKYFLNMAYFILWYLIVYFVGTGTNRTCKDTFYYIYTYTTEFVNSSVVSNWMKLLEVCYPHVPEMFWNILISPPYLSCIFLIEGSSADVMVKEKCYGGYFNLPYFYAPPLFNGQLYFTPSNSASRQLVIDKGEVSIFLAL